MAKQRIFEQQKINQSLKSLFIQIIFYLKCNKKERTKQNKNLNKYIKKTRIQLTTTTRTRRRRKKRSEIKGTA